MPRRGLVFAICLAGLAVAVAMTLAQAAPRPSGTNLVTDSAFSIGVPAGASLCQPFELVPADTAKLAVTVTRAEGEPPPLDVRITADDGALVSRGHVSSGYAGGPLTVPVEPPVEEPAHARVCIGNRGQSTVGFGSGPTPGEQAATVEGGLQAGRIRIEYLREGSDSWRALLPTIGHRFGVGKGGVIGSWGLWAAGFLLLLAIGVTARLLTGRDGVA